MSGERRYCRKEDLTPLEKIKHEIPDEHPTERHGLGEAWSNALNGATNVRSGMARLVVERPDVYYRFGHTIELNLRRRLGYDEPIVYPLESFAVFEAVLSKPLVLAGAHRLGKTSYAIAHGAHPLLVHRVEDLRRISYFTDVVIWKDPDFRNLRMTEVAHLLMQGRNRSLRARHTDVYIDSRIKLIFVMQNGAAVEHASIFPTTTNELEMTHLRSLYDLSHVQFPMWEETPSEPPSEPPSEGDDADEMSVSWLEGFLDEP